MTALASTLALLLFQTSFLPQERPEENSRWLCWSYSAKGSGAIPVHESHPIQWFTSNIAQFDAEVKQRLVRDSEWKKLLRRSHADLEFSPVMRSLT